MTVSRLKRPNNPADLDFLHYISFNLCFGENTEAYFWNKPFFFEQLVPSLPPCKASFCVTIAVAEKTISVVHGHTKNKDVTVTLKSLTQ